MIVFGLDSMFLYGVLSLLIWPYLELAMFNQAYQGVLPSIIPLEQSSANQKLIYNTEYSIKPNVQAKLDLNSPQMTLAYSKLFTYHFQSKTV